MSARLCFFLSSFFWKKSFVPLLWCNLTFFYIYVYYISIDTIVSSMGRIGIGSNWRTLSIKGRESTKTKVRTDKTEKKNAAKSFIIKIITFMVTNSLHINAGVTFPIDIRPLVLWILTWVPSMHPRTFGKLAYWEKTNPGPFARWVVSPSFIHSALKNEIWQIPLQIFVFWML